MTVDKRPNEIIRIQKKRNNFVMMDKGFLNDERLSFKAKGILAYLLSKPDNWKVIVGDLIKRAKDGKKAVYSGLRELKEHGYYKKIPVRDETGRRISHWESVIFECPEEQDEPQESNNANSLVAQNGKVDETRINTASSLLTPFVYIDNVQIQNDDIQNGQRNNNYLNNNYSSDNESSQSQRQTDEKTDMTLTNDYDQTASANRIIENKKRLPIQNELAANIQQPNTAAAVKTKDKKIKASALKPIDHYRQAEAAKKNVDDYITYERLIRGNIEYNFFPSTDIELVDSLVQTMLDVILTESPASVKIGKETKSREIVKSVYLKLKHDHIEHVIRQYKAQHHQITYKAAYLRTMLYTVLQEIEPHYTNEVRADGMVW